MNDFAIMSRVREHLDEAESYFKKQNIIGIFLQGSQNYGLSTDNSDVDTKLVVTPSLHSIIMNHQAVSTTHVRENNEHIDFKDIRLMLATFRKQNLNFLEILFTYYFVVNPMYQEEWDLLKAYREAIAHYNIYGAMKAMKGMALEKYHALEHPYPSRMEYIEKYGYDPKQLHHLLRIEDFLRKYKAGVPYENCMCPDDETRKYLIDVKLGLYNLEDARKVANESVARLEDLTAPFTKDSAYNKNDEGVDNLLDYVQEKMMRKSIKKELV